MTLNPSLMGTPISGSTGFTYKGVYSSRLKIQVYIDG